MREPVVISIIHASNLVLEGITDILKREPQVRVVGAFAGAADALAHPDHDTAVILYDLHTLRQDGLDAVDRLRERLPAAKVLIFGVTEQDQDILDCVKAAASGCILDTVSLHDLVESIRAVTLGATAASPQVVTSLFNYIARTQARGDQAPSTPLTPREEQILQMIAEGLDNKEIAERLHLQPQTVKNYVHLVLQKLNLNSRLDVIRSLRTAGGRANGAPTGHTG